MVGSYAESSVRDLINDRPARAGILEKCGIDFCRGGEQTLAAACRSAGASVDYLCGELMALDGQPVGVNETAWTVFSLGELVDDIVERHHAYLRTELPRLVNLCAQVVGTRGRQHADLRTGSTLHSDSTLRSVSALHNVQSLLRALADQLTEHMDIAERVVFPCVLALQTARQQRRAVPIFHCGSICNPISVMLHEHQEAGEAMRAIRRLTQDFHAPAEASPSYVELLKGLRELEEDLHLHMHKENNLLFPRAVRLEAELSAQ